MTKGKKLRAALVPIEDFKTRFLDKQAEEEREKLLEQIKNARKPSIENIDSVDALRRNHIHQQGNEYSPVEKIGKFQNKNITFSKNFQH